MQDCAKGIPLLSLASLKPGQQARVASVNTEDLFGRRLRDLGFVPGSRVYVRRQAPLKDPMEYEIRNSRVCLRRKEAQSILVQLLAVDPVTA